MSNGSSAMTATNDSGFDFITPFRYLFDSPDWGKNILLATLCLFIPFVGPIVLLGWQARILRALTLKQTPAVPAFDFNEFAEYLKEGLVPFLANLVAMLPLVFLIFILGIVSAIAVPLLARPGEPVSPAIIVPLVLASLVIGVIAIIGFAVFVNAVMTRALLSCDLGKTFEFGAIMDYAKQSWKSVLVVVLIFIPASMIFMILGMLALFIGMYPASIILNVAGVHFIAQIYQQYLSKGGAPIPVAE